MKGNFRWILIAISVFAIINLSGSVLDLFQRRNIIRDEQKRLDALKKRHDELTQRLAYVQTPAFVEQEAREKLGMAKEGETVILTDQTMPLPDTVDMHKQVSSGDLPNWKRWWRIFFEY